jgi:S-adenosylmethionine decarboxylase proenzyme
MPALAQHTLLELHDCDALLLSDAATLRPLVLAAIREGNGTVITEIFHTFSPHGVSGVVVIAESHVAIHTWPEHRYAAVDIFSCSPSLDHGLIGERIATALESGYQTARQVARGEPARSLPAPAVAPGP